MDKGSKPVPDWAGKNQLLSLIYKTFRMIRDEGFSQMLFAVKYVVKRYFRLKKIKKGFHLTPRQRAAHQAAAFGVRPKISLLTPLYNTRAHFLRELLDSFLAQSYDEIELCLVDASGADHPHVEEICGEYAARDPRIRYHKLSENGGIAANVNAAMALASGDYVARLDHDDLLAEGAMYELAKTIDETGADLVYSDEALFMNQPKDSRSMHFKPDFSPDYLRGCNYICHLMAVSRELLAKAGPYNPAYDGSEDYDFTLRAAEKAQKIAHIATPLYYWRTHAESVASDISAKPYAYDAARRAVQAHLDRTGLKGEAVFSKAVPMIRVIYEIPGNPLVSIIIPTCDHAEDLRRCVDSITEKSTYANYELVICENNSTKPETFAYYEQLKQKNVAVATWAREFNFSAINNFARTFARGSQLIFLNNDTEIITPDWIQEMVMFTQRADVGACGVKLLYPNGTVQHGGIAVGIGGSAANLCPGFPRHHEGYMSRLAIVSNVTACTAACLCVRAEVFDAVGGFDEQLAVSFNDVDLCLKIREKGYRIVFNPVAELWHYESRSRGYDRHGARRSRMEREKEILRGKWPAYYTQEGGDPYYNRNFGKNSVSYDA